MTALGVEVVPVAWDDERDARFFRITAHVFSAEFCLGATLLLAARAAAHPDEDLVRVRARRSF